MATSYFADGATASSPAAVSSGPLSPATPSTPATRTNALQNRITSVLSASYADLEIRDALSILDARGVENTADTRRNLRLDVQDELIKCNGEIIQDFGKVANQLKRIGAAISSLNDSCMEMRKHIASANRETRPMLEEARVVLADKAQVETRQQLLNAFASHFIVSNEDLATLTSTAEPVDDAFFRVLTRVKKIHADSQVLLGTENQRLGLEILEASTRNLDAAYNKLYRHIQREFSSLDLENPHLGPSIRRSLRVLAERPSLFQSCLDNFSATRESILSNNFYASLTGTPVDQDHPVMGKAIELSAHDPLRYISDMLAWAHSAAVSEREALEMLFIAEGDEIAQNIKLGLETDRWAAVNVKGANGDADSRPAVFDGRAALRELLTRVLDGVFQQLRQRAEQVIATHSEDAVLAYKISNLVLFYQNIFRGLLGEASSLLEVLERLADTARKAFGAAMKESAVSVRASVLAGNIAHVGDDFDDDMEFLLAPPEFLVEALGTIRELLSSYESSLLSSRQKPSTTKDTTIAGEDSPVDIILSLALSPFLSLALEDVPNAPVSAKTAKKNPLSVSPQKEIYEHNIISLIADGLSKLPLLQHSSVLKDLNVEQRLHEIEERMKQVVYTHLCTGSGLVPESDPPSDSNSATPQKASSPAGTQLQINLLSPHLVPADLLPFYADPTPLAHAAQKFDAWLPGATEAAWVDFLRGMRERRTARSVVESAVEDFVERCETFVGLLSEVDAQRRDRLEAREQKERARRDQRKTSNANENQDSEDEKEAQIERSADDDDQVWLTEVFPRTADEIRVLLS